MIELRAEADFYGLLGLVTAIDRFPFGLTRVQRAVSLNTEDSWMYEDGQDEVCVCVFNAVCSTIGGKLKRVFEHRGQLDVCGWPGRGVCASNDQRKVENECL